MDTIVNLPGGNPLGRSKYYLNDAATLKKLKEAAKGPNIVITPKQNNIQIKFNAGSYVEVVLRLLRYWETMEGQSQLPEDVDGLVVMVAKVETVQDAKGTNERHIVRLSVQGEQVTITLWDTTCGMGVQAASMLVPYTDRVLFPYLRQQIGEYENMIMATNEKIRTHGEVKVMTRHSRQQELVKNAAILESPIRSVAPLAVTDLDSPAPVRLLNKLLTWVTPSRAEEQEEELEEEQGQDVEEEQGLVQEQENVCLALTFSPPKRQQGNSNQAASQDVACFPCNKCENVFSSETSLRDHIEEHTGVVSPSLASSKDRPLTASGRLLVLTPNFGSKHIRFQEALNNDHIEVADDSSDDEDESNDCQENCKVCKKTFLNVSNLQDHILTMHSSQSDSHMFKCDMCQYKAATKEKLLEHVKNNHEYITPCTVCGEEFRTVSNLQVHILTKHCTQSDAIVQLLKKQEQTMIGMQKQIGAIASQLSLINLPPQVPLVVHPAAPLAEQAPPPSYSAMARAPAPQEGRPPGAPGAVKKILYITDSIGGNIIIEDLEKATKAKIIKRRAYGAVKDVSQTYPISNFTDVVPKEMTQTVPDVLVLQRDSITLTNLSEGAPEEYAQQQVKVASQNMVSVATTALASNPRLQQVVLMQAPPRYDGKDELNKYGNKELLKARDESTSIHKQRVVIGVHNLDCEGNLRASRFGDGRKGPRPDMIHMKGPSGKAAFTRSVACILASAGLTTPQEAALVARPGLADREQEIIMNRGGTNSFQVQGRKGRKGQRQQQFWQEQQWKQPSPFEVATYNRFASFQGNW